MNTNTPCLSQLLTPQQLSLPPERQAAIAVRQTELSLLAMPAYLREVQANQLEALRSTDPELADELNQAIDAAEQAIELGIQKMRAIAIFLNNQ